MKSEEHDPLNPRDPMWDLLGKARQPKERPFFAAKVMRAIREEKPSMSFFTWLRAKWVAPVAVAACAVVAAVVTLQPPSIPTGPKAVVETTDPDVDELIEKSIDQLLVAENQSAWLSADPSSFQP